MQTLPKLFTMKLYTILLLAAVLSAVFVSTDAAAIIWDSASNNNLFVSTATRDQTPTELVFRFVMHTETAADSETITITATGSLNNDIFTGTSGSVTCTVTSNGAEPSTPSTCAMGTSGSGKKDTLIVTANTHALAAGFVVVTVTDSIAPNDDDENVVTFVVSSDNADGDSVNDNTGWTLSFGKPQLYFLKSTCRQGGPQITNGAEVSCAETNCQTCSGAHAGFVVTSGKQTATDVCNIGATLRKYRCDALYYTETSVDIAVSTEGLFGTLTCGAYKQGETAPDKDLNSLFSEDAFLYSVNSVYVNENDKASDQVVSLFGLPTPGLQYDIYCHMDNAVMSPALTVWTDKNDRITGVSLLPAVSKTLDSPVTITLTFTHVALLEDDDTIVLSNLVAGSTAIMNANPSCTGTASGNSDPAEEIIKSAVLSGDNKVLTLTVDDTESVAGSTVTIICNGAGLLANPAANTVIQYDLTVSEHPVSLENLVGWKVTS